MTFERWQVVRVPFPFTDRTATKNRPALVLSGAANFNGPAGGFFTRACGWEVHFEALAHEASRASSSFSNVYFISGGEGRDVICGSTPG